jgi:hypothetical protein
MKPPTIRSSHQPSGAMSVTQVFDVFQSSWTSWSSKIIELGHRREQPAHVGLAPRLPVQARVLLEVRDRSSPGGTSGSRRERMNSRTPGETSSA